MLLYNKLLLMTFGTTLVDAENKLSNARYELLYPVLPLKCT